MKKRLNVLFLLSLLALASCGNSGGGSTPTPPDPPDPPDPPYVEPTLDDDTATDYVLDDTVSNENGSMNYEIFVRSFYDADGNGIGDLKGVEQKLPYLASLGVKSLWLMPIHPSPTYHGYDVSNYYEVAPELGTLADFDSLVATANTYHIDIMLDMVFNHCSRQNPWFVQSYYDFKNENTSEDSKINWFTWSDKAGGACNAMYPNDNNAWYEARFDSTMPDFNFDCQAVKDELENVIKFWVKDHGVKGFRLDAVKYYYYENVNKNIPVLDWIEQTGKKYYSDFYTVGECWSAAGVVNDYHRSKADSFFRFEGSYEGAISIMNVAKGRSKSSKFIDEVVNNVNAIKNNNPNGYPSYFMSNHDMNRSAHAFQNEYQAKASASLLAFLPGTSYMYYGEEIGMLGKRKTSPEDYSDVRRRLPMVWSETNKQGECIFPEANRQDLNNNEQVTKGVEDRLAENFSVLKHYQKVNNVRNKYPFIKNAKVQSLIGSLNTDFTNVMAYKLYSGDEYIIVVHNFNEQNVEVTVNGTQILDTINTYHRIPTYANNKLTIGAYSTVIIK